MNSFDQNLADNFDYVLSRVKKKGMEISFASDRLKNDHEIVKAAVDQDDNAFMVVGEDIKCNVDNLDIMKFAVLKDNLNFSQLSDNIKEDIDLVIQFVDINCYVYDCLEEWLKRDEVVIEYAFKKNNFRNLQDDPIGHLCFINTQDDALLYRKDLSTELSKKMKRDLVKILKIIDEKGVKANRSNPYKQFYVDDVAHLIFEHLPTDSINKVLAGTKFNLLKISIENELYSRKIKGIQIKEEPKSTKKRKIVI